MDTNMIEASCAWLSKAWFGSIMGIIGVLWGVYSHFKARRKAQLLAQFSRMNIISPEGQKLTSDVQIIYKGKEIPQLSKTNVILWNQGTEVVYGSSVVESAPICITFSDKTTRVLRSQIIKETRKVNKASLGCLDGDTNKIVVSFDYLDPQDGINIEILHDNRSTPHISGAIRGLPSGIKLIPLSDFIEKSFASKIFGPKYFFGVTAFTGLLFIGVGLLEYLEIIGSGQTCFIGKDANGMMAVGALNVALPLIYFWICGKRYPRKLHD